MKAMHAKIQAMVSQQETRSTVLDFEAEKSETFKSAVLSKELETPQPLMATLFALVS